MEEGDPHAHRPCTGGSCSGPHALQVAALLQVAVSSTCAPRGVGGMSSCAMSGRTEPTGARAREHVQECRAPLPWSFDAKQIVEYYIHDGASTGMVGGVGDCSRRSGEVPTNIGYRRVVEVI
jgi:hypothetical protein